MNEFEQRLSDYLTWFDANRNSVSDTVKKAQFLETAVGGFFYLMFLAAKEIRKDQGQQSRIILPESFKHRTSL